MENLKTSIDFGNDDFDQAEALKNESAKAAELKEMNSELINIGKMEYYNQAYNFLKGLEEKHGREARRYKLFHIIAGSTYDESMAPFFDFEGKDSMEAFLRKKYEEIMSSAAV